MVAAAAAAAASSGPPMTLAEISARHTTERITAQQMLRNSKVNDAPKVEAVGLLQRLWADECAHPQVGPRHEMAIATLEDLAVTASFLPAKVEEVRAYCAQLVSVRTNKLGADHTDTLRAHSIVVTALERAGKFPEALAACVEHIDRCKRAHGVDSTDTLEAMSKAALLQGLHIAKTKPEWTKAAEALREIVKVKENSGKFGKLDKSTLRSALDVGEVLEAHGDVKGALAQYEQTKASVDKAAAAVKKALGPLCDEKIKQAQDRIKGKGH